jgi:hypothetical protein
MSRTRQPAKWRLFRFLADRLNGQSVSSRRRLHGSRRFCLERLEVRCVPALVQLGTILKETFDDPADLTPFVNGHPQGSAFDDIGRITLVDPTTGAVSYQQTHPVFHHLFTGTVSVFLQNFGHGIGTTVPTTAPGDVAGDLFFNSGDDTITFPDVNSATEGVALAALDIHRDDPPFAVDFIGDNGAITLTTSVDFGTPGRLIYANSLSAATSGNSVILGSPPRSSWDTLVVGDADLLANGTPLGMIHAIVVHGHSETEIDNLRVVIASRTPTGFGIGQLNVTAEPGVPKLINALQNDLFGGNVAVGSIPTNGSLGTAATSGGAFVTYTARPGTHGPDSFTYLAVGDHGPIVDAEGNFAIGTVNVLVNTPPVAPSLTIDVPHGTAGTLTGQFTVPPDADGDPLTFSKYQDGNSGTVTITPTSPTTATFTYTRTGGGVIPSDTFSYQVSDGLTTAVGQIQLVADTRSLADPVDDPVPLAHGYSRPVTVNVLANDPYPRPNPVGPFGDPLHLQIMAQPSFGFVQVNPDNTITYTPRQRLIDANGFSYFGPQPDPNSLVVEDTFTYELVDIVDGTSSNVATVHLTPDNQAPAPPLSYQEPAGRGFRMQHGDIGRSIVIRPFSGLAVEPLGGSRSQGDPTAATDAEGDRLHLAGVGGASGGQVQLVSPTEIVYTPSPTTLDDTFNYAVADDYGAAASATIHISWLNDPPVLIKTQTSFIVYAYFALSQPVNLELQSDDEPLFADADGDHVSFKLLASTTPFPLTLGQYDPNSPGRIVQFNPDGTFDFQAYVHQGHYAFTVAATDGYSDSAPLTLDVHVIDPPVPRDDDYAVTPGVVLHVDAPGVRANDYQGSLSAPVGLATAPPGLDFHADGSFDYTPPANFIQAEFAYEYSGYFTGEGAVRLHLPPNDAGFNSATTGDPVLLYGDTGTTLFNIGTEDIPGLLGPLPPGVHEADFPEGTFDFTVGHLPSSGHVTVRVVFPAGVVVNDYFKFGKTRDSQGMVVPAHWYEFPYDPITDTGAQTQLDDPLHIPPNEVILHLVDGGRGDDDVTADGFIHDPGGPALFIPRSSVSGSSQELRGRRQTFNVSASDPSAAVLAAGFSYTVDWGDGSPVQTVPRSPANGAGVPLDHAFMRTGTFTVKVTAADANGTTSAPATTTITITDQPVAATGGFKLAATEAADSASQTVATFTDPGGAQPVGYYAATIAWGDGANSGGVITFDQTIQRFTVSGHHAYSEEGSYPIAVMIQDGSSPKVTAASMAVVADAPLTATPVTVSAIAGGPFGGVVGAFTDADPNDSPSNYSATISWGDGTTSVGVIKSDGKGGYTVSGGTTYAAAGKYTVTVQIRDIGGSAATDLSSAAVTSLGQSVQSGLAGGIGFWHNKNGQALINGFSGGGSSTVLSNWLVVTLPNLYGVGTGVNNLTGFTNAQVAGYFQTLFAQQGPKLGAQVLAVALDVYATTRSLGGTAGAAYGFRVTDSGLAAYSYNVGAAGVAFDVANNTVLNAYQILRAVNRRAVNGLPYGGDLTLELLALVAFDGIATAGGIP